MVLAVISLSKASVIDFCENFLSFPLSRVMISFSFFAGLLSFFFVKDQIASFKFKQIEGSVPCVFCTIHYAMNQCGKSVGFHLELLCGFGSDFVKQSISD